MGWFSRHFGRSTFEGASFLIDRQGTVLGFDQRMEQLTGWPAVEVVGSHKDRVRAVEGGVLAERDVSLWQGAIDWEGLPQTTELTLSDRRGGRLDVEATIDRLPGPGERATVRVLRVLARSNEKAVRAAEERDPLTGLLGRRAFGERLTRAFAEAEAGCRPLALILIDIDQLRRLNERLGFGAGNHVLQKLAGILRAGVSEDCQPARLGDDDFALLLPDAGRGEARQLAARLRSTVERFRFLDGEPEITLSIGAACYPADAESADDLVRRAGEALRQARRLGRNRVWCYARSPRVPVEVPVYFDADQSLLVGISRDLSPSGVFVQTAAPVDVGMRCALQFPIPGQHQPVRVIGRVVRTVPPEIGPASRDLRIPGMGIEFERFGPQDRGAIERFLHLRESA